MQQVKSSEIVNNLNTQIVDCGSFRVENDLLIYTKIDKTQKLIDFCYLVSQKRPLFVVKPNFNASSEAEAIELEKQGQCIRIDFETLELLKKALERERNERIQKIREEALQNVHLEYAGLTEDFGRVYGLSTRVPPETWKQISEFFFYASKDDELGCDADYEDLGWVTTNPGAVEEILQVRSELTIEAQRNRAEQKKQRKEILKQQQREIISAFRDAEKPDPKVEQPEYARKFQPGFEKMIVPGERIDDPHSPQNIYGGGQWFVIQTNWIWFIEDNGMDGDDWSQNNVETGGAGAIGVRVPYSQDLEEKIRKYAQR